MILFGYSNSAIVALLLTLALLTSCDSSNNVLPETQDPSNIASYYDANYPVATYREYMDRLTIRFSTIVQRDSSEFLIRWNYPASDSAIATIRSLDYSNWLPPGWE